MKQLPTVVFKVYSYVGTSICRLCVPNVFEGRAGFDLKSNPLFSQGVLEDITLGVGIRGLEIKGLELMISVRLPGQHCPIKGWDQILSCWSNRSKG